MYRVSEHSQVVLSDFSMHVCDTWSFSAISRVVLWRSESIMSDHIDEWNPQLLSCQPNIWEKKKRKSRLFKCKWTAELRTLYVLIPALEQLLKIVFYIGLIEIGNISFVVFPFNYSMINTLLRSKHYNIYIYTYRRLSILPRSPRSLDASVSKVAASPRLAALA